MKLAGAAAIVGLALSGCGAPLWQSDEAPPRASQDAAAPAAPSAAPPARETERPEVAAEVRPRPEPVPERKRAPLVAAGIAAYDDGKYAEAAKALRAALATRLEKVDQVAAHKYLAFIECSTNRRSQCRDEFRKALRIDPSFDLEPAEAGHPVWGPVFRGLKPKPKR